MLKATLAYNGGYTGVCPPSAFLSKAELGWAALAVFWWQVAWRAQEVPVQYWAVVHPCFHTFSRREFGGQSQQT